MSARSIRAATQDDPGQPGGDTHAYRAVLDGLITIGADFARLLHAQATAQAQAAQPDASAQSAAADAPAPAPEALINLSAAFDQIARAIRRSIILARSLDLPVPPARDPAVQRTAARKRIIREVEDRIGRATDADPNRDTEANAADLHAELRDRLDAPDLDDDITTRPVAEIITEICRDLGLASPPGIQPWQRRTPADVADLHARAAAPTRSCQPSAERQGNRRGAPACPSDPQRERPPAVPHTQPGPVHAANSLPIGPRCHHRHDLAAPHPQRRPMAPTAQGLNRLLPIRPMAKRQAHPHAPASARAPRRASQSRTWPRTRPSRPYPAGRASPPPAAPACSVSGAGRCS